MDTRTPDFLLGGFGRSQRRGLKQALASLWGFLATGAALAVGAVFAVFAAAAVALLTLFAGALMVLTSLAFRARRGAVVRRAGAMAETDVIEARKVGSSWVAYGWDRDAR
jgi:cobalamin biosynthesis protein CobD/CbiB